MPPILAAFHAAMGRLLEWAGTVLIVIGLLVMVGGVAWAIYRDARKKARKRREREEGPDR